MRALSLWQPWAQFMTLGWKRNETRSWSTPYRGPLVIHATKRPALPSEIRAVLEPAGLIEEEVSLGISLGAFLCVVQLVDCVRVETIRDGLSRCERAMGDYSDGRFAWVTRDCRPFEQPIPGRGAQGLFIPPLGVIGAVTRLINLPVPDSSPRKPVDRTDPTK